MSNDQDCQHERLITEFDYTYTRGNDKYVVYKQTCAKCGKFMGSYDEKC